MTRPGIAWWIHQAVEYLVAVLLISQGIGAGDTRSSAVLAGSGFVIAAVAMFTDAPLSLTRRISPAAHTVIDVVIVVVLAVSPLVASLTKPLVIALVEGAAVTIAWLAIHTPDPKPARRRRRAQPEAPSPPKAAAPVVPAAGSPSARVPSARDAGARVGRLLRDGPRQAGRIVGRRRGRNPPAG